VRIVGSTARLEMAEVEVVVLVVVVSATLPARRPSPPAVSPSPEQAVWMRPARTRAAEQTSAPRAAMAETSVPLVASRRPAPVPGHDLPVGGQSVLAGTTRS
jgi:hypothetical protein